MNAEKGVESVEKVLEGVGHILAEAISEMAAVRDAVRKVVWKTGRIVTAKAEIPEGQGLEYRDYFDYSEPVAQIPPHRVLAINRGDKEGPLKVRLDVSRPEVEAALFGQLPLEGHPHAELFRAAAIDALDRLILPSMEREVRRDLTEAAEKHAVEVFAKNLRSLLLQPPIPKQVVLAIDPGFRTGCKVAVLDRSGNLLDQGVIYPHPPQNRRSEAKLFLKDLVGKHQVGRGRDRQRHGLPRDRGAGRGDHRRGNSVQPGEAVAADGGCDGGPTDGRGTAARAAGRDATPAAACRQQAGGRCTASRSSAEPDRRGRSGRAAGAPARLGELRRMTPSRPGCRGQCSGRTDRGCEPFRRARGAALESRRHPGGEPHPLLVAESPLGHAAADLGRLARRHRRPRRHRADPGGRAATSTGSTAGERPTTGGRPKLSRRAGRRPDRSRTSRAVAAAEPSRTRGRDSSRADGESPAAHDAAIVRRETPVRPRPRRSKRSGRGTRGGESVEQPKRLRPSTGGHRRGGGRRARCAPAPPPSRGPASGATAGPSRRGPAPSLGPRHAPPPPPRTPPKPHPADALLAQLAYVVVNEAGASVYSTSQVGRDELPDSDATLRSGISIGRRLQDPLAELVKIEPQNIGVGLYQHDVNPKQLKETLESVISSCVNFVGVDLNTASVPLLRHVSGLNQLTARRIVEYRKEHGPVHRPRAVDAGRGNRSGDLHAGGGLSQDPRGRASARPDLDPPRELRRRHQAAGEARLRAGCGAGQGSSARAARQAGRGRSRRAGPRAGGRRVHAPRHHRRPGASRARPSRRSPQADLQEGDLEDRRLERRAWSSRGRS